MGTFINDDPLLIIGDQDIRKRPHYNKNQRGTANNSRSTSLICNRTWQRHHRISNKNYRSPHFSIITIAIITWQLINFSTAQSSKTSSNKHIFQIFLSGGSGNGSLPSADGEKHDPSVAINYQLILEHQKPQDFMLEPKTTSTPDPTTPPTTTPGVIRLHTPPPIVFDFRKESQRQTTSLTSTTTATGAASSAILATNKSLSSEQGLSAAVFFDQPPFEFVDLPPPNYKPPAKSGQNLFSGLNVNQPPASLRNNLDMAALSSMMMSGSLIDTGSQPTASFTLGQPGRNKQWAQPNSGRQIVLPKRTTPPPATTSTTMAPPEHQASGNKTLKSGTSQSAMMTAFKKFLQLNNKGGGFQAIDDGDDNSLMAMMMGAQQESDTGEEPDQQQSHEPIASNNNDPARRFACGTRIVDATLAQSGNYACCGEELFDMNESACLDEMVVAKHTIPPPPPPKPTTRMTTRRGFVRTTTRATTTTTTTTTTIAPEEESESEVEIVAASPDSPFEGGGKYGGHGNYGEVSEESEYGIGGDQGGDTAEQQVSSTRLQCGSNTFEVLPEDEAARFYSCCGDRLFDTRKFACIPATTTSATTSTTLPTPPPPAGNSVQPEPVFSYGHLQIPEASHQVQPQFHQSVNPQSKLMMLELMLQQAAAGAMSTTTTPARTTTPSPTYRSPTVSVICGDATRYEIEKEEVHRFACCGDKLYDTSRFACENQQRQNQPQQHHQPQQQPQQQAFQPPQLPPQSQSQSQFASQLASLLLQQQKPATQPPAPTGTIQQKITTPATTHLPVVPGRVNNNIADFYSGSKSPSAPIQVAAFVHRGDITIPQVPQSNNERSALVETRNPATLKPTGPGIMGGEHPYETPPNWRPPNGQMWQPNALPPDFLPSSAGSAGETSMHSPSFEPHQQTYQQLPFSLPFAAGQMPSENAGGNEGEHKMIEPPVVVTDNTQPIAPPQGDTETPMYTHRFAPPASQPLRNSDGAEWSLPAGQQTFNRGVNYNRPPPQPQTQAVAPAMFNPHNIAPPIPPVVQPPPGLAHQLSAPAQNLFKQALNPPSKPSPMASTAATIAVSCDGMMYELEPDTRQEELEAMRCCGRQLYDRRNFACHSAANNTLAPSSTLSPSIYENLQQQFSAYQQQPFQNPPQHSAAGLPFQMQSGDEAPATQNLPGFGSAGASGFGAPGQKNQLRSYHRNHYQQQQPQMMHQPQFGGTLPTSYGVPLDSPMSPPPNNDGGYRRMGRAHQGSSSVKEPTARSAADSNRKNNQKPFVGLVEKTTDLPNEITLIKKPQPKAGKPNEKESRQNIMDSEEITVATDGDGNESQVNLPGLIDAAMTSLVKQDDPALSQVSKPLIVACQTKIWNVDADFPLQFLRCCKQQLFDARFSHCFNDTTVQPGPTRLVKETWQALLKQLNKGEAETPLAPNTSVDYVIEQEAVVNKNHVSAEPSAATRQPSLQLKPLTQSEADRQEVRIESIPFPQNYKTPAQQMKQASAPSRKGEVSSGFAGTQDRQAERTYPVLPGRSVPAIIPEQRPNEDDSVPDLATNSQSLYQPNQQHSSYNNQHDKEQAPPSPADQTALGQAPPEQALTGNRPFPPFPSAIERGLESIHRQSSLISRPTLDAVRALLHIDSSKLESRPNVPYSRLPQSLLAQSPQHQKINCPEDARNLPVVIRSQNGAVSSIACCGSRTYDPMSEVCCGDVVTRPPLTYDPSNEAAGQGPPRGICCAASSAFVSMTTNNVTHSHGNNPHRSGGSSTMAAVYHPLDNVPPMQMWQFKCCGTGKYNILTEVCTKSGVSPKTGNPLQQFSSQSASAPAQTERSLNYHDLMNKNPHQLLQNHNFNNNNRHQLNTSPSKFASSSSSTRFTL